MDLVEKLSEALIIQDLDLVYAATMEDGEVRTHPVFALMKSSVTDTLLPFLSGGGRKIDKWFESMKTNYVVFDDVAAFANVNTVEELRALQG
jgi:molybdopterin-guanine dinucleotide biosynthesis protein A